MLAGASSLWGLHRWSRHLATGAPSGKCQVPAGTPSCAPRVAFGAKFVHCGVLVTEVGAARGGHGWWCSHACLHGGMCVPVRPMRAPAVAHHVPRIACGRHKYQLRCAGEGAGQQRWRAPT